MRPALPTLSLLLLAYPAIAREPAPRPSVPSFQLPSPPAPATLDHRADPPEERVRTYPDPRMHMVWLAPAIGVDARVKGDPHVAFGAEVIGATPFQIWRGAWAPGFFPTLRASWRGRGTLDGAVGFGFGVFEDDDRYKEGWKALSYTPQVAWRLVGSDTMMRGFRQDLVFKPGIPHLGIAHVLWPNDGDAVHELRLVIGASFVESW